MNIRTVCFTGHRDIPRKDAIAMPSLLKSTIEELIVRGAKIFRAGGAMGFDTVAALCVLELREKYPEITLHLILPCKDQTNGWNETNLRAYKYVLENASSVEYVTDTYTKGCMHERNKRLVNGSDVCIAYCRRESGGSAYTLSYAESKGLETINICNKL